MRDIFHVSETGVILHNMSVRMAQSNLFNGEGFSNDDKNERVAQFYDLGQGEGLNISTATDILLWVSTKLSLHPALSGTLRAPMLIDVTSQCRFVKCLKRRSASILRANTLPSGASWCSPFPDSMPLHPNCSENSES